MSSTSGNGSTKFDFAGGSILPNPTSRSDLSPASYTSNMIGGSKKNKRSVKKMIGCASYGGKKRSAKRRRSVKRTPKKLFWLF